VSGATLGESGIHSRRITLPYEVSVRFDAFTQAAGPLLRSNGSWLGHNGVSVSTRLEQGRSDNFLGSAEPLKLLTPKFAVILGAICLYDELRPEVSVSRDALRDLSFGVRSAIQLAVRRSASVKLGMGADELVGRLMQEDLLTDMVMESPSAAEVENDSLWSQWRAESFISKTGAGAPRCSLRDLRGLADNDTVQLSLPFRPWSVKERDSYRWRSFYETLQLAMTEFELDIELDEPADYRYRYDVNLISPNRPFRPVGLSVLPVFFAVPYSSPEILIAAGRPANLKHPVIRWFADQADTLSEDYPAFFAQIRRALASVVNLDYESAEEKRRTADKAAQLLNETIDRIRRSVPSLSVPSFPQITADDRSMLR
jgi:hypothetical protein